MSSMEPSSPQMSSTDEVIFFIDEGIATIKLNRPERRNALSIAANKRIFGLWDEIDRNSAVRVVVVTSADCGTFCAGMDLKEAAEVKERTGRDILDLLPDPMYQRMRTLTKPVIAAMTGHFTAGGMVLCMNSDLRVGLAGTKGGITEAKIGRGSPWAVPMLWMLPEPIVSELVLTGELMPVERLHALGFVNYVEASADEVRARAYLLAHVIRSNAPLTVTAGKKAYVARWLLERKWASPPRLPRMSPSMLVMMLKKALVRLRNAAGRTGLEHETTSGLLWARSICSLTSNVSYSTVYDYLVLSSFVNTCGTHMSSRCMTQPRPETCPLTSAPTGASTIPREGLIKS